MTLEKYDDVLAPGYLCIRMRFKAPDGKDMVTTCTKDAFKEGLYPPGTLLWSPEHIEQAARDYFTIMKTVANPDEAKKEGKKST